MKKNGQRVHSPAVESKYNSDQMAEIGEILFASRIIALLFVVSCSQATARLYKILHNLGLREKTKKHEISIDELPDLISTSWFGGSHCCHL